MTYKEHAGQIGRNLRRILKQQGKSQRWLSRETGIDVASISHYCAGDRSDPSLWSAVRICMALGISMDDLVQGWCEGVVE